jgi:peptidoglycan/LPS O-acetylase OafA/YrhL
MRLFLSGMITMGFFIAGLFFVRFWSRTRDRLFLAFAVAFWLFAANQALVPFLDSPGEAQGLLYTLRLAGFVLLIVAIVSKNMDRFGNRPGRD